MYEVVKKGIPFVLAGSIRDDGPLKDVITDVVAAQKAYVEALRGAGVCLMLASALHSIAVGNLLPARVRTVCVDMTESVPVKLSNRGTMQAIGLVTDVGLLPRAPGSRAGACSRRRRARPAEDSLNDGPAWSADPSSGPSAPPPSCCPSSPRWRAWPPRTSRSRRWPPSRRSPTSQDDDLVLPAGFTYDVVIKWGDAFTTGGERFGYNNDFIGVFPLAADDDLLLWINHEYVSLPTANGNVDLYGETFRMLRGFWPSLPTTSATSEGPWCACEGMRPRGPGRRCSATASIAASPPSRAAGWTGRRRRSCAGPSSRGRSRTARAA